MKQWINFIFIALFFCPNQMFGAIKTNKTGTTPSRIASEKDSSRPKGEPFVSVYGELRAVPPVDVISLYFQYNIPTDRLTVTETNDGTVTGNDTNSDAMLTLAAPASGDVARVETKAAVNYIPGHEITAMFTAGWPDVTGKSATGGIANTTQYIGIFNDTDGFAVGYNGVNFGILHRYNTNTNTFVNQSSFNIDKLDGTGPSGFILDQSKINIFYISFGWLGVASIEFAVIREDGLWIPFHKIQTVNARTTPTILNPSLPMRAEVAATGGSTQVRLQTASWNASISGSKLTPNREFTYMPAGEQQVSNTTKHPVVLRNKTTFANKTSTARCRLVYLNVSGRSAGNIFTARILKNPTITNPPSFTDIDASFSVVDVATDATVTKGSGTQLFATGCYGQSENTFFFIPNNIFINFYPGETIAIEIEEFGTGAVDYIFSIGWEEYY